MEIFSQKYLNKYFNYFLDKVKFPNYPKLANITPLFKEGARTSKKN